MRAVDTNFLVRLVAPCKLRQPFVGWSKGCGSQPWHSQRPFRYSSRLRTSEIGSAVETLLNHKDLTLQDSDAVAAALKRFRERPTVGFSDCLLLELARKEGHLPLGTFDRNLSKLDGAHKL